MAEREGRSRVFISYARIDQKIALRIRDSLIKAGFDAYLDVHDIAAGEPWRERLGSLIASAEKVVFLISPHSVASEICTWEVDQTERLAKTLLPVVVCVTPLEKIPGRLSRLNFIFMRDDAERATNNEVLIEALTQDLAWEREKTRLGELATAWDASGRPERLLVLIGEDAVRTAETWRDGRPPNALPPAAVTLDFLRECRQALVARERRARRRALLLATASLVALAFVSGLSWILFNQWRDGLRAESLHLSDLAAKEIAAGRPTTAALLSLEALQDPESTNLTERLRPLVREARVQLYASLAARNEIRVFGEGGLIPVSIVDAAMDPTEKRVVTLNRDGIARLYDADSGAQVRQIDVVPKTIAVAFDSERPVLRTASEVADEQLQRWTMVDVQSWDLDGQPVGTIERMTVARFLGASVDPVYKDGHLVALNPPHGDHPAVMLSGHSDTVNDITFSDDGALAATASGHFDSVLVKDASVRLWNAATGEQLLMVVANAKRRFSQIDLRAPDWAERGTGSLVALSDDQTIRTWTLSAGLAGNRPDPAQIKATLTSEIGVSDDPVSKVEFGAGGRLIVALTEGGIVRVYRPDGVELGRFSHSGLLPLTGARLTTQGDRLLTWSLDGSAHLFQVAATNGMIGPQFQKYVIGGGTKLRGNLSVGPDGRYALELTIDRYLRVIDTRTGEVRATLADRGPPLDAQIAVEGDQVVVLLPTGSLMAWRFENNEVALHEIAALDLGGARVVALVSTGAGLRAATVSSYGVVRIWDVRRSKPLFELGESVEVAAITFSRDGTRVVTADGKGRVILWSGSDGRLIKRFEGIEGSVDAVDLSADGQRAAAIGQSGCVWDVASGDTLRKIGGGTDIQFAPDGEAVVAVRGARAEFIELSTGARLAKLEFPRAPSLTSSRNVYMGGVSRAAFTAQRDRVVLADTNGNARVFEFTPNYQDLLASARRQAVRCLTEDERATFRLSTAVPDWCVAQNKWPYIATHARIEKAH